MVRSQRRMLGLIPSTIIAYSFLAASAGGVGSPHAMQLQGAPGSWCWIAPASCCLALRGGADGAGRGEGGQTGGETPQPTPRGIKGSRIRNHSSLNGSANFLETRPGRCFPLPISFPMASWQGM